MGDLEVFGNIITGEDVADAVIAHIRLWTPTYLAMMERRFGYAPRDLPLLRSFVTATDNDPWAEDQLPGCMVIAPGLLNEPERHGDGSITAVWQAAVGIVTSGNDRESSLRLAHIYAACARACVVQHQSLGGFAQESRWLDEAYDDYTQENGRTHAVGIVGFGIMVKESVNTKRGKTSPLVPDVPPADPYTPPADPATVQTVFVSVNREEP